MVLDMAQRDYYEILGIDRSASPEQIKAAYRRLARKHHPDVSKAKGAADKFKEATAAYEVLSDPQRRKMYDQFGHAGPADFGSGKPGRGRTYTWTSRGGGPGRSGRGGRVDFEDIFASSAFSGMSLEELLASLSGYAPGSRWGGPAGPGAAAPAYLEYPITLDFMQAVKGCTTTLQLRRPDGGTQRIEVKIPPGVQDGTKVRVRGKPGTSAGGDLLIVTRVREHPYFRRDGADIYVELPISLTEAALGGEVTVPTVDGRATVKIPPGASGGTRLRLRGKGTADPKSGSKGDQYVVLKIVLPREISEEGRKLLSELARTDPYDPRKKVPW